MVDELLNTNGEASLNANAVCIETGVEEVSYDGSAVSNRPRRDGRRASLSNRVLQNEGALLNAGISNADQLRTQPEQCVRNCLPLQLPDNPNMAAKGQPVWREPPTKELLSAWALRSSIYPLRRVLRTLLYRTLIYLTAPMESRMPKTTDASLPAHGCAGRSRRRTGWPNNRNASRTQAESRYRT